MDQINKLIHTECQLLDERVVITGTSREDLNGRVGVATSFDHEGGRYVVELDGKGKNKPEMLKIKPENLAKKVKNRGTAWHGHGEEEITKHRARLESGTS